MPPFTPSYAHRASSSWLVLTGLVPLMLVGACSRGGENPNTPPDARSSVDAADTGLPDGASSPDGAVARDGAVAIDQAPAPDLLPTSNDPSDPSSCLGAPLVFASKFPMGASTVVLGPYTMQYQKRSCTDFTGCGSWGPASPSWGPSGRGNVWLKVTGSGIIPAVVDSSAGSAYGTPVYNLGMDCAAAGSVWSCGNYRDTEVAEGANSLKFEGADKFHGVELPIQGDLRATCARFYGSVMGVKSGGAYTEYRGGFLIRY